MSVQFAFHYVPAGQCPAAEVASSHFLSLFNCDPQLLQKWNLWPGFVREYRENSRGFQEWMETQSDADWEQFLHMENPAGEGEMYWASSPFTPAQARNWAQTWTEVLARLDEEEIRTAFPLDIRPRTGASRFDSGAIWRELQMLISQCDCALQNELQMTVDMTLN